jgi:MFS family permease
MFGMIIYLPLFMQGVMGVTATRSGNLLTPLLLGVVVGTFVCGQLTMRLRGYKVPTIAGSLIGTAGTVLFARMDASTPHLLLLVAMVAAGFGIGLIMPAYTVAVQNAAPHRYMGVATASATFFRSIGSTVGVAVFGSLLLTNYHHDFAQAAPEGIPQQAMSAFSNPLLLPQLRPQLDATFARYQNGPYILQTLYANVGTALLRGLQAIFLISAILMGAVLVMNLLLKDTPLRHGPPPAPEP